MNRLFRLFLFVFLLAACLPAQAQSTEWAAFTPSLKASETSTPTIVPTETPSFTPVPATLTFTAQPPTETSTSTPMASVESLKAKVTADLLSCRYGPGSEYLYLYALRKTANIELIGRTDGNNWVMVKGKNLCWVNAKFLEIAGDPKSLKVMYPDGYKIPVSPYYSSPAVYSAKRDANDPNLVTVFWSEMALRAGDEEDESMFIYIIEVWRCESGQMIFDPLASNYAEITFIDEAGCSTPSHGRVYFQEKHGYAGPAEIPWPAR